MNIAVAHPGKIGDLLFCLPTVRELSERHRCLVDVYTSPYCRAALEVIQSQSYVRRAIVLDEYVMEHFEMGAQPWQMPVPAERYDAVYQLGFRDHPDRHCVRFVAHQVGLPEPDPDTYRLETPETGIAKRLGLTSPYVVITTLSSTGGGSMTWDWSNPKVSEFVRSCPHPVYAVGLETEWNAYQCAGQFQGLSGLTFLEIADVMKHAIGVVTYSTGLGVLAAGSLNGSDVPLVCLFDGEISWDVYRLPGALTCSPDEGLAEILFRQRSSRSLELRAAELERERRHLMRVSRRQAAEIDVRRPESAKLLAENVELARTLHERNVEAEGLRAAFAEAHHQIHALNLEIEELRTGLADAHHQLHSRNLENDDLHRRLHARNLEFEDLNARATDAQLELDDRNQQGRTTQ